MRKDKDKMRFGQQAGEAEHKDMRNDREQEIFRQQA
jgi:hypothetical protein